MRNFVIYRGTDKFLARPQGNKLRCLSEWRKFPSAPCLAGGGGGGGELDDSSRLDVGEIGIACVPDVIQSLFPTCSG